MVRFAVARNVAALPRALPEALTAAVVATLLLLVLPQRDLSIHRVLLATAYLALLFPMAVHDVRYLRVPNAIVYSALGLGLVGSLSLGWGDAAEAFLGGAAAFAVLLMVTIAGRGAMGFADVKVGTFCGVVVGLGGVVPMLALTFVSGGLLAAVLLILRLRRRNDVIAFTPFLIAATAFSIFRLDLYLLS